MVKPISPQVVFPIKPFHGSWVSTEVTTTTRSIKEDPDLNAKELEQVLRLNVGNVNDIATSRNEFGDKIYELVLHRELGETVKAQKDMFVETKSRTTPANPDNLPYTPYRKTKSFRIWRICSESGYYSDTLKTATAHVIDLYKQFYRQHTSRGRRILNFIFRK